MFQWEEKNYINININSNKRNTAENKCAVDEHWAFGKYMLMKRMSVCAAYVCTYVDEHKTFNVLSSMPFDYYKLMDWIRNMAWIIKGFAIHTWDCGALWIVNIGGNDSAKSGECVCVCQCVCVCVCEIASPVIHWNTVSLNASVNEWASSSGGDDDGGCSTTTIEWDDKSICEWENPSTIIRGIGMVWAHWIAT